MILSLNKYQLNIFPLLSKALGSKINSCYSMLFSNQNKKEDNIINMQSYGSYIY